MRRHADPVARTSVPVALDLAPWHKGHKHLPVQASIPWIPGWKLAPKSKAKHTYSKADLSLAFQQQAPEAQILKQQLTETLEALGRDSSFSDLNRSLLPVCQHLFPSRRRPGRSKLGEEHVQVCIQTLWAMHARLQVPGPYGSFISRAFEALRRQAEFQAAHRQLRSASRQQRRLWFEEQGDSGGASSRHQ